MKLIHLSDLHLGKRVNEFSMLEDQAFILKQILEIADREKPDGVLLAGDLYDKPVPPAEAVGLLDWFLTELSVRKIALEATICSHSLDKTSVYLSDTKILRFKEAHFHEAYFISLRFSLHCFYPL